MLKMFSRIGKIATKLKSMSSLEDILDNSQEINELVKDIESEAAKEFLNNEILMNAVLNHIDKNVEKYHGMLNKLLSYKPVWSVDKDGKLTMTPTFEE